MPCTAVTDRSGIDLAFVKPLLRLAKDDAVWDAQLTLFVEEALEVADTYCNNPFVDADGVEMKIPARVRNGVVEWVRTRFDAIKIDEDADRHYFTSTESGKLVGELREGQTIKSITRDLGDGTKETTSFHTSAQSLHKGRRVYTEREIKRTFWAPYRMTPGF
jgi:hypothetical protein